MVAKVREADARKKRVVYSPTPLPPNRKQLGLTYKTGATIPEKSSVSPSPPSPPKRGRRRPRKQTSLPSSTKETESDNEEAKATAQTENNASRPTAMSTRISTPVRNKRTLKRKNEARKAVAVGQQDSSSSSPSPNKRSCVTRSMKRNKRNKNAPSDPVNEERMTEAVKFHQLSTELMGFLMAKLIINKRLDSILQEAGIHHVVQDNNEEGGEE